MKKILFFLLLIFVFVSGYSSSYAASKSKSYDKSSSVHELLCEAGIDSVTLTVNGVTATTTCAPAVAGKCGTADDKPSSVAPSGPSLCEKGNASAVSGSGPWTWTCAGTNGGSEASCDAPKQKYTITAKANPTTGGSVSPTSQTVNHGGVALVNATAVSGYKFDGWTGCTSVSGTTCTVSNVTSNKSVTASFSLITNPVNGACGGAISDEFKTQPMSNLCSQGKMINMTPIADGWKWTCEGILGGKSDTGCFAKKKDVEPPKGKPFTTQNTGYQDSTYISSYTEDWTSCAIDRVFGSKVQCKQTSFYTPVKTSCQEERTVTQHYDADGKYQKTTYGPWTPGNCLPDAEQPAKKTEYTDISFSPSTSGSVYANNSDSPTISIQLSGNTKGGKSIIWDGATVSNITDASTYKANRINNTGDKALNFASVTPTYGNNLLTLKGIKSYAPLQGNGDLTFNLVGGTIKLTIAYHFKKPFVGSIKTYDFLAKNWDGKPTIGTIGKFNLIVQKSSALSLLSLPLPGYTLNDFKDKIEPLSTALKVAAQKVDLSTLTQATGTQFEARIDTSDAKITKLPTPGLQVNLPVISYILGGKDVSYYLSANDGGTDTTPISTTGKAFIGIKIIGGLQGQGKQEITGQKANISNLYTFNQRTEIRKNAYTYVRGMSNTQVVNRVKYVEGDVYLSSRPSDYDTLVVINGNLTINGNIASSSNPFGIIVIQDAYDVNNTFSKKGNIYITPNVTKINAIIYSDGGIISATPSGQPYKEDSVTRTQELQNQLTIVGSVFTRNTIGGAISANGGKYLLPGGGVAPNFDQAMIYDFNYLRRGNEGCAKKSDGKTCVYEEPFILQYDSRILKNPPKLFSIGK